MLRRFNLGWLALLSLLAARLLAMDCLPLMDTSEPRYAEIARTMLVSGDWITPWFTPEMPFWGKPPLSFWAQALAMKIGGINEFSARMPGLFAIVLALGLLYRLGATLFDARTAWLAILMCASSPLIWLVSGVVVTDPFLTLGVTLSLVSLPMALRSCGWAWRYGFFIGIALGLLAKGPLTLVLIGVPVAVLWWFTDDRRAFWCALPWWQGCLLTLLLVLPWYIAAELKTPGFLRYFLLGEHVLRFLEPGWQGDLYGNGHQRPQGMIWVYFLIGALPWSALGILLIVWRFWHHTPVALAKGWFAYLSAWAAVSCLLFTSASNILPTYVEPSLPALCLLVAAAWRAGGQSSNHRFIQAGVSIWAVALAIITVWVSQHEEQLKTEKSLVAYVQAVAPSAPLVFLEHRPYSARFYSHGQAQVLDASALSRVLASNLSLVYVAIPNSRFNKLAKSLSRPLAVAYRNRRNTLLALKAGDEDRAILIDRLDPPLQKDAL